MLLGTCCKSYLGRYWPLGTRSTIDLKQVSREQIRLSQAGRNDYVHERHRLDQHYSHEVRQELGSLLNVLQTQAEPRVEMAREMASGIERSDERYGIDYTRMEA